MDGGPHHDVTVEPKVTQAAPTTTHIASRTVPQHLTRTPSPSLALRDLVIQAKLSVGPANDPLEREADETAASVVRSIRSRRRGELAITDEPDRSDAAHDAEHRVRRAVNIGAVQRHSDIGALGGDVDSATERAIRASKSGGAPLDNAARATMETAFGADFGAIRVHTGSLATDLNNRIQAKAFTTGRSIYFRDGLPDTSTTDGQSLLAHELTHTVQQGAAPLRRTTGHETVKSAGERVQRRARTPELRDVVETPPIGPRLVSGESIQRHASWEHKMLGDVTPDALEIMGAARNTSHSATGMRGDGNGTLLKVTQGPDTGKVIDQEMVLHTIEQEVRRLEYFRDTPPTSASSAESARLAQQDTSDRYGEAHREKGALAALEQLDDDREWNVRLVSIPLSGGICEVVTYGEMNTLADFYGSTDELLATDPGNFSRIVRGIRQESLFKFMRLFEEISGTKKYQEKARAVRDSNAEGRSKSGKALGVASTTLTLGLNQIDSPLKDDSSAYSGLGFEGAIGNTGTGDLLGEARLAGMVPGQEGKQALVGQKATAYDAGLGRNACHFAPESWHSWAACHTKARALGRQAWDLTAEANDMTNGLSDRMRSALRVNAEATAGRALIENGFGDHFLEDSYAAGHLINKTQIMQWYVQWLDTQNWKSDHASAEGWRHIQQIAYGQGGLSDTAQLDRSKVGTTKAIDPQSVENQGGDWQSRFAALGLKIPGSVTPGSPIFGFTVWWQGQAAKTGKRSLTMKAAMKEKPGLTTGVLAHCLRTLIDDGVAKVDGAGIKRGANAQIGARKIETLTFELREDYVPKDSAKFDTMMQIDPGTGARSASADEAYAQEMARITYADYHQFLNNGFIQAASNVLHDRFCQAGLSVGSAVGDVGYRIYGDNAMLQKESSRGLVHSATTANMSRDSIYSIITTGAAPHALNDISDRFPNQIEGQPLVKWHEPGGPLMKICHDEVFPKAQSDMVKGRLAGIFKSKLTAQISKDDTAKVHTGDLF